MEKDLNAKFSAGKMTLKHERKQKSILTAETKEEKHQIGIPLKSIGKWDASHRDADLADGVYCGIFAASNL